MSSIKRTQSAAKPRLGVIAIAFALVACVAVGWALLADDSPARQPLDLDLCSGPPDERGGGALLLLDLSKPLETLDEALSSALLKRVTAELGANAELRVFAMASVPGTPGTPRRLLERVCKPYANDDLNIAAAKDQGSEVRDCSNLPAQLSRPVRHSAEKFCARREALSRTIAALAAERQTAPVANAHMAQAIEDAILELSHLPRPHSLYVLSDLMHHSPWYSHIDLDWADWRSETFAELRSASAAAPMAVPPADDLRVRLFYVPRKGSTEHPRARAVHKQFWRDYFAGFGAVTLAFEDQPTMAMYSVEPLLKRGLDTP